MEVEIPSQVKIVGGDYDCCFCYRKAEYFVEVGEMMFACPPCMQVKKYIDRPFFSVRF